MIPTILTSLVATRRRKIIVVTTIVAGAAILIFLWLHGMHPHTVTTPGPSGGGSGSGSSGSGSGSGGTPSTHHGNTEFAETRGHGHHRGIEKQEILAGNED